MENINENIFIKKKHGYNLLRFFVVAMLRNQRAVTVNAWSTLDHHQFLAWSCSRAARQVGKVKLRFSSWGISGYLQMETYGFYSIRMGYTG